jgi:hypothetical protein
LGPFFSGDAIRYMGFSPRYRSNYQRHHQGFSRFNQNGSDY